MFVAAGSCSALVEALKITERDEARGRIAAAFLMLADDEVRVRREADARRQRGAAGVAAGDFFSPLALLAGSPLALAAHIAATRVRENWHREVDVAAGASCAVCLESFATDEAGVVALPDCGPRFHLDACLKPWLTQAHTCPVCRKPLPQEEQ
jgi:hypothetical protein